MKDLVADTPTEALCFYVRGGSISPRIQRESATSEPECRPDENQAKADIARNFHGRKKYSNFAEPHNGHGTLEAGAGKWIFFETHGERRTDHEGVNLQVRSGNRWHPLLDRRPIGTPI